MFFAWTAPPTSIVRVKTAINAPLIIEADREIFLIFPANRIIGVTRATAKIPISIKIIAPSQTLPIFINMYRQSPRVLTMPKIGQKAKTSKTEADIITVDLEGFFMEMLLSHLKKHHKIPKCSKKNTARSKNKNI